MDCYNYFIKCSKYEPSLSIHSCILSIHFSNVFLYSFFEIFLRILVIALFWLSTLVWVSKRFLIKSKSQKSHGARSGEYGGCLIIDIPCSERKDITSLVTWGRALSCNIFHFFNIYFLRLVAKTDYLYEELRLISTLYISNVENWIIYKTICQYRHLNSLKFMYMYITISTNFINALSNLMILESINVF